MTFTQTVKTELVKNSRNLSPCCKTVFLGCLIRTMGELEITSRGFGFSLSSENLSLLTLAATIAEKTFGTECMMTEEHGLNAKSRIIYNLSARDDKRVLFECGVLSFDANGARQISHTVPPELLADECCKKTFVSAMFAACGAIGLKDGYHCEFSVGRQDSAEQLSQTLAALGFSPKINVRKDNAVVYLKGGEQISDLLVMLGAVKAALQLQSLMVERSVRNTVNRQTNCISANIDKTVEASEKQLAAIKVIEENIGLEALPPKLKEAAILRKENPSESLDELVRIFNQPVSKSGLNHRLRKIINIAVEIKGGTK